LQELDFVDICQTILIDIIHIKW